MVKKVKRKFNFKKFLILILLIYIVINGTYYLLKRPVKNIIITGNKEVKDYEIIEAANLKNYPSFISINKSKITKNLKQNPFIKDVQIKKNFKFQINRTLCLFLFTLNPYFDKINTDRGVYEQ